MGSRHSSPGLSARKARNANFMNPSDDLIAFLEPAPSQFQASEWRDATGTLRDIQVTPDHIVIRAGHLAPGLYRGEILTREGAFDMRTAMVEMTRVPDGRRVLLGPWDLDHLHNVMAMPMALVTANGRFRGGLWFSMPGPEKIAKGILDADFGFEHEGGPLELEIALPERERKRLSWDALKSLILRRDNRRRLEWPPAGNRRPRFYTGFYMGNPDALRGRLGRLEAHRGFEATRARILAAASGETSLPVEPQGIFDAACVIGFATQDTEILAVAKRTLLNLCARETWSGRPDPLLMGGDNDRGVGINLYHAGVGWEFLRDSLTEEERRSVLDKAAEYLSKILDFTILQRGYMGCPTADPHSLGTWQGVGVACMAFYEELPIARKALPFFHALMIDSLALFPASGKAAWATMFPSWMVRYLAAALEFGGRIPEVDASPFLDRLAQALLACFRTPNAQEMQRGLRTVEHRMLVAFLAAFHPTEGVESIYEAFVAEELRLAGDVHWGMFDLVYGPPVQRAAPAAFPEEPLVLRDIGSVIATLGPRRVGIEIHGGNPAGARNAFLLKPHNREYPRAIGEFLLRVGDDPVLIEIQGSYGIFSAQRNALCFEGGGIAGEGQYLSGDIPPEKNASIRRFLRNERFLHVDIHFAPALQERLGILRAQRAYVLDRKTGLILIRDSWQARNPLKVASHLTCAGRVTPEGPDGHRLTGGQANRIIGKKYGDMGLSDEERGEIHVRVLDASAPWSVRIVEPKWIPGYIYKLNDNGKPDGGLEGACYPKLQRWQLEFAERVQEGGILLALGPDGPPAVSYQRGVTLLPDGSACLQGPDIVGDGWKCAAEAAIHDHAARQILVLGATRWECGDRKMDFCVPVDIRWDLALQSGTLHSPTPAPVTGMSAFKMGPPKTTASFQKSLFDLEIAFH